MKESKNRIFSIPLLKRPGKAFFNILLERLDLPKEMAMHGFSGGEHPLDRLDILVTAGCGQGFQHKLAQRGVRVMVTGETDPRRAIEALASNAPLPPPAGGGG